MSNLSKLIQMRKAKAQAPAVEAAPVAPAETPKRGLGLNLLKAGAVAAAPPAPKPAATPAPKPAPKLDDTFSLEDIASMDASSIEPAKETSGSGFFDEIEATAPDRDLPGDLTSQQLGFVEQLDGIYQVQNDADMFAQAVRVIMMELQENPEYIKLVSDQDVHSMIRGMRNSMGLARIRKQEKSRKTGTSTKKAAQKKSSVSDDAMALLDSLGFDDD